MANSPLNTKDRTKQELIDQYDVNYKLISEHRPLGNITETNELIKENMDIVKELKLRGH